MNGRVCSALVEITGRGQAGSLCGAMWQEVGRPQNPWGSLRDERGQ